MVSQTNSHVNLKMHFDTLLLCLLYIILRHLCLNNIHQVYICLYTSDLHVNQWICTDFYDIPDLSII